MQEIRLSWDFGEMKLVKKHKFWFIYNKRQNFQKSKGSYMLQSGDLVSLSVLFLGEYTNKQSFLASIIGKEHYYSGDMHASPWRKSSEWTDTIFAYDSSIYAPRQLIGWVSIPHASSNIAINVLSVSPVEKTGFSVFTFQIPFVSKIQQLVTYKISSLFLSANKQY